MTLFLIALVSVMGFSVLGKLIWITKDDYPRRTRSTEVVDVVFSFLFIVWAAALLAAN